MTSRTDRTLAHHVPDEFGCLAVTCWCERTVVRVPTREVAAGLTRTCRRVDCNKASVDAFESNRIKPKNQGAA